MVDCFARVSNEAINCNDGVCYFLVGLNNLPCDGVPFLLDDALPLPLCFCDESLLTMPTFGLVTFFELRLDARIDSDLVISFLTRRGLLTEKM